MNVAAAEWQSQVGAMSGAGDKRQGDKHGSKRAIAEALATCTSRTRFWTLFGGSTVSPRLAVATRDFMAAVHERAAAMFAVRAPHLSSAERTRCASISVHLGQQHRRVRSRRHMHMCTSLPILSMRFRCDSVVELTSNCRRDIQVAWAPPAAH
jgi:hypothetical protein